jgi:hypothetical protein
MRHITPKKLKVSNIDQKVASYVPYKRTKGWMNHAIDRACETMKTAVPAQG